MPGIQISWVHTAQAVALCVLMVGDKVRVVVKTISVSRKALAAGLDADDLVGTVQEVWGMENEGEDGSGLTVLFEGAGDADDFEYIFSEFELEKVVEAAPGEAPAAAAAAGGGAGASGPVDERQVTATLALSPGGGGAGAPTQAAVLDLLGEAVLEHEAFAGGESGVEVRFTPLGVSLVGTWGAVVRAAGVATDALMRGGASSAVVTLTMVVS